MSRFLTSERTASQAGYFRIGNLILDIPPDQIQCHKVINGDEVMPLRFPFAIPVKTGQSRWDVTWSWKALKDDSQDDPYSAWRDVQTLLAMFKAAPFVEVENEHIRQMVNPGELTSGATADDVMAFALRQMRVDTIPDLIDALQITMTMSLFNYRPYSSNFQYDNGAGTPVPSALASPLFDSYLNTWIQNNLNSDPTQQPKTGPAVSSVDWIDETPGSITFTCREYVACPIPHTLPLPQGAPQPSPNNPSGSPTAPPNQSGYIDNVYVSPVAVSNPEIAWWVSAVASAESNGNYNAINLSTVTNNGKPSAAVGILQWVRAAAIDALKSADKYLGTSYVATAVQGGFLVSSSRSGNGYSWNPTKTVSNPRSADPAVAAFISWMTNPPVNGGATQVQNDMATAWAVLKLQANAGSVLKSWEAHRFGQGIVNNGQGDPSKDNAWFTKAVNSWKSHPDTAQAFAPQANTVPAGAPQLQAQTPTATSGVNTSQGPNISNSTSVPGTVPMTYQIRYYINNGWTYDYATEAAAFLYKEHFLKLTSEDPVYGDQPACSDIATIDPTHFVYPNQISVVFLNNIAQIPLASYQYPTYQHLGPVSTVVSVGLISTANIQPATDLYSEPEHTGLSFLSNMTRLLEDQFQRLRNEWRRVNSLHRMQTMAVKSQILNLLGIRGLLTKELTTETIPDVANMVSAQYNAIQYEDIYSLEEPDPFKVTVVPVQLGQQWFALFRDGTLNQFKNDGSLNTLTNLSDLMQHPTSSGATSLLFKWLTGANPSPPSQAYLIPTPVAFTATQQALMRKVISESGSTVINLGELQTTAAPSFEDVYPDLANQILNHSQMNFSDLFLIRNGISNDIPDYQAFQNMAAQIDQSIITALAANPSFESPINQMFDQYLNYAVSNNVLLLRDQMVRVMQVPAIKSIFVTPDGTSTPGALQINKDHGCYIDMGIRQLQLGGRDYTPAVYFFDNNKILTDVLQSQINQVVQTTVQTSAIFAQATPYSDKSNLIQTSTESFSGNVKGILSTVKPSSYTMTRAFPTFKLFLMEDHSDRPFYAYDNFYSYATVTDMEVIRYRDKPDEAVIQISNTLHLLDQHLYDSTPQGRFEQRLRANTEVQLQSSDALTGGVGGAGGVGGVQLDTAPGGEIFSLDNRFPQINATGDGDQKFPLKYFALQTGTKIQVRMGFSNNPDLLVPVFTGQVTEIQGDDVLTITAQSYMLELIQPTTDEIRHDGFAVDSFINKTSNALLRSVRDLNPLALNLPDLPAAALSIFNNDAAYGGWGTVGGIRIPGILTTGGATQDVMSAMLKVSSAKHFGFWQPGAPTDPYLKGYSWQAAVASALLLFSNSPLTRGATGLESGYDRSFENVLTTHVFGPDGTATADTTGTARGWWFERPLGYGAPEYHVPKDPNLTPWTLIQDIARRYPEFILAVKQYGFPFTADATLVFANPHDFYITRPPMPGESEVQQQAASDNTLFNQWWSLGTNSGRAQFIAFCQTLGGQWANIVLVNYDKSIGFTGDSATSTLGQTGALLGGFNPASLGGPDAPTMRNITANQLTTHIDGGGVGTFFTVISMFVSAIGAPGFFNTIASLSGNAALSHTTSPQQAQQNLQQIIQNYYNYLQQKQSADPTNVSLSARVKPVRRYHLINGDNIVHNGIKLNEKFYNSVKLANQTLRANAAIPSQYTRVLNADPFVVSQDNLKAFPEITNSYMQSFLRDEAGKMYRGELVLIGNPEIEPYDVLVMLDPSTGISGPIEVDSVIHSFNMENGFITIVRPRAFVILNDKLSAPLYLANWKMLTDIQGIIEGQASKLSLNTPIPGTGLNTTQLAEVGVGAAAVAGAIAAGPWIAGATALAGGVALFWAGKEIQRTNPFGFAPLTRFERPWVGGLEGWRINDLLGFLQTQWNYFKIEEIEPLLFSYRTARGMQII